MASGSMEGDGAPAVGDHCRTVRRIGGDEQPSTSELVRLEPPHVWSVHGIDSPIRARVDLTVDSLSESRSRLSIAVDFEDHGIGRLLIPLIVRGQARAETPDNLAKLKREIESHALM